MKMVSDTSLEAVNVKRIIAAISYVVLLLTIEDESFEILLFLTSTFRLMGAYVTEQNR